MPNFTQSAGFKVIRDLKAYLKKGPTRDLAPEEARSSRVPCEKAPEKERQKPRRKATANNPQVFFIIGGGKSGTTWLKRLLNAHPDAYRFAVRRHHDLLEEAVHVNRGVVFETVGDAVCAAFARSAVPGRF